MTQQFALVLTVALVGCAATTQEDPIPVTTSAIVAAGVEARDAPHVAPKPAQTYTDAQVLALLTTYNKGQVDLTSLAHARSKDPRVLSFAKVVHDDHAAALAHETHLADLLVMRPATTEKMRNIEEDGRAELVKLRQLSGHEFDVEFASNQVLRERDALAMLDIQLIPSARVPEIRAHLADFRDRVDHHLRDASELKRTLGGPVLAER